jgi:hypothetical protein
VNGLWRYWGYLLVVTIVALWAGDKAGPGVLMLLSLAATLYFFLQAPVWCGAATRGERLCRNNASGLLLGCHLRQHKWQKLRLVFVPAGWRRLNRGLWSDPKTGLATIGAILAIASTASSLIAKLVT